MPEVVQLELQRPQLSEPVQIKYVENERRLQSRLEDENEIIGEFTPEPCLKPTTIRLRNC